MNLNIMEDNRIAYIDIMKGIAILVVVAGHCIPTVFRNVYQYLPVQKFIMSFEMPLFMFLSGYLSYREKRQWDLKWIFNKFLRLMIPFYLWILLPHILKGDWNFRNIVNDFKLTSVTVDRGYWYLMSA